MATGGKPRKMRHYDWVIPYRMRRGLPTGRNPTWPEIREFLEWGNSRGLEPRELAELAGVSRELIWRWKARITTLEDIAA